MLRLDRRHFTLLASSGAAAIAASLLGGCGSSRSDDSASPETESPSGSEAAPSTDASSEASQADQASTGAKAITVVFSWSGNTLKVAERASADVGCELFRIEPAEPYTTDYDEMLDIAQDEQAAGTLPALASTVADWASYDTVYLGFPTWWGHLPQIVVSFLAEYDCTGKVIHPFNTHAGSGFASTLSDLAAACPGVEVREGLSIPGTSVDESTDQIDAWAQAGA